MLFENGVVEITDRIKTIFETNVKLLGAVDKAVLCFREGKYEDALEIVVQSGAPINLVAEAVIHNREYFDTISVDTVAKMLQGILDASQKGDYVFLADLYEMQLSSFIRTVQEIILGKEQYLVYDGERYRENIQSLETILRELIEERDDMNADELNRFRINLNAELEDPFDAEKLLKKGFSLEFAAGGRMTITAPYREDRIYLHSVCHTDNEAYLLAKSWFDPMVDEYIVYGLGMGYHIEQLHRLAPEKRIIVYESDLDIFKLFCAFGGDCRILSEDNIFFVYDKELKVIGNRIKKYRPLQTEGAQAIYIGDNDEIVKICVHYPSYRRTEGCEILNRVVPWAKIIEQL